MEPPNRPNFRCCCCCRAAMMKKQRLRLGVQCRWWADPAVLLAVAWPPATSISSFICTVVVIFDRMSFRAASRWWGAGLGGSVPFALGPHPLVAFYDLSWRLSFAFVPSRGPTRARGRAGGGRGVGWGDVLLAAAAMISCPLPLPPKLNIPPSRLVGFDDRYDDEPPPSSILGLCLLVWLPPFLRPASSRSS